MEATTIIHRTGMSTRPEYYSGYGANESDLSSLRLRQIRDDVQTHHGPEAADALCEMVFRLETLAPTSFLLAFYALAARGWRFADEPTPSAVHLEPRGKTVEEMSAVTVGTLAAIRENRSERQNRRQDEAITQKIKSEFFFADPKRGDAFRAQMLAHYAYNNPYDLSPRNPHRGRRVGLGKW